MMGRGRRPRGGPLAAACRALVFAGLGLVLAEPVAAGKYPSHPIKMIVPLPSGGTADAMARAIVPGLAASLGQPIVLETHSGDATGIKAAATARPDGYTLFFGTPGPLAIAPSLYPTLGYDPTKVFAPVAIVATSPQVLTVNADMPVKSVHDLTAYAKAQPGKIKYASLGYGTQSHLLSELLKTTASIDLVHVPYEGSAEVIPDLLTGRVQVYFTAPATIAPHIAGGRLHALAIASENRSRLLPDVPTMIESGFGRFIANYWSAIAVPSGTPEPIVKRLNTAVNETLRSGDVQKRLSKLGAEPKIGTPQEAAAFLAAEAQKWSVVAKAAGIGRTP
jgi:tripartite-type tricarboxylate transporter receptor subunit TctC